MSTLKIRREEKEMGKEIRKGAHCQQGENQAIALQFNFVELTNCICYLHNFDTANMRNKRKWVEGRGGRRLIMSKGVFEGTTIFY